MPNGLTVYHISGKFVTTPTYNEFNTLQSVFVVDGDTGNHGILVIMTSKIGHISVGRFKGSLQGSAVWKSETTESLRNSIKVNAPAQLRVYPNVSGNSAQAIYIENALNGIMQGNWFLPDHFNLNPAMVGVVQ